MITLTPDLLVAAVGCSRANATRFAPHLDDACRFYRISDSPARLAAFLAQVGHESGSLQYTREIASGSAYDVGDLARRLGNTPEDDGDGERLKGRGLIQTTGASNYRRTTQWLREALQDPPDFIDDPVALEQPRWAAWSAAAYWHHSGLTPLADAGRFVAIGRAINRGNPNSSKPANGEEDRLRRWSVAKAALAAALPVVEEPAAPEPQPPEQPMPAPILAAVAPAFLSAAASAIADAVPKLGELFAGESPVAKRNVQAATIAVEAVKGVLGAKNEQEIVEQLDAGAPEVVQAVRQAVEAQWFAITEAGGGGIAGAREADLKRIDASDKIRDVFKSHSFWIAAALLPMVYMIVASLIGVIGTATWSDDVRAGLSGSIVSAIIGGLVGYYFGQTTSRNRT